MPGPASGDHPAAGPHRGKLTKVSKGTGAASIQVGGDTIVLSGSGGIVRDVLEKHVGDTVTVRQGPSGLIITVPLP